MFHTNNDKRLLLATWKNRVGRSANFWQNWPMYSVGWSLFSKLYLHLQSQQFFVGGQNCGDPYSTFLPFTIQPSGHTNDSPIPRDFPQIVPILLLYTINLEKPISAAAVRAVSDTICLCLELPPAKKGMRCPTSFGQCVELVCLLLQSRKLFTLKLCSIRLSCCFFFFATGNFWCTFYACKVSLSFSGEGDNKLKVFEGHLRPMSVDAGFENIWVATAFQGRSRITSKTSKAACCACRNSHIYKLSSPLKKKVHRSSKLLLLRNRVLFLADCKSASLLLWQNPCAQTHTRNSPNSHVFSIADFAPI